ncbi:hypothetical protein ASC80_13385 [Afipia sp. Root123D2]|uniref:hypothetical protein n=1 Tax=Afipia sp. Root123D2 TaxID=1736436 RepID=UPI0006F494C9|nr:hypothetical protein [Afipia sp. Root123D2]KQW21122.1 hypothetical protein ASC80_13385 [Afipia sp. Root123D2]
MRDLFTSFRTSSLAAVVGAALGLLAMGDAARAANPLELNFWLSGPRYDGQMGQCEQALNAISYQFAEKESTFWNSSLQITGFDRVHETAFRPWSRGAPDTIPRRFCSANALLSDGRVRQVHYSITEDGGFAGYQSGVQWCVVGLDRNWAYNPSCKSARP